MKTKSIHLGEAELEIMRVLWRANKPLTTAAINQAVADKGWKRTTVSTFLTRLAEKGTVTCEKQGNLYFYTACLSAGEWRRHTTGQLIRQAYGGSAKELAAALFEEAGLTAEDLQELQAIVARKTR